MRERIEPGEPFALLYIDIDNFKAYNDYYSYQRGDEAIKLTASIILHAVGGKGGQRDFIGHIGGDDFVVLSSPDRAREVADEIVREFDEKIPALYSPADRDRGFIEVVNRQNVDRHPADVHHRGGCHERGALIHGGSSPTWRAS
jgi:diguanylate cyclase (GGDEF)-like protein